MTLQKLTADELNLHLLSGQPIPVLDESYKGLAIDLHLSHSDQLLAAEFRKKRLLKPLRYVLLFVKDSNGTVLIQCLDGRVRSIAQVNALRARLQLSPQGPAA